MGWRPVPAYRAQGRLVATVDPRCSVRTNAASSECAYEGDAYARGLAPSPSILSTKTITDAINASNPTPSAVPRISRGKNRNPGAGPSAEAPVVTSSTSTATRISAEGKLGATSLVAMLDPQNL